MPATTIKIGHQECMEPDGRKSTPMGLLGTEAEVHIPEGPAVRWVFGLLWVRSGKVYQPLRIVREVL
jgi:hypothetical protein